MPALRPAGGPADSPGVVHIEVLPIRAGEVDDGLSLRAQAGGYKLARQWLQLLPPTFVMRAQLRQDVRMPCRQVGCLRPVGGRVIKLLAVHQSPLVPDHRRFPFFQPGTAVLDNQLAVGKRPLATQQSGEAEPVKAGGRGRLDAAQLKQRRQQVLNLSWRVEVASAQPAGRPADPARHAVAAVVESGLAVAQPGVPDLYPGRAAVVGQEQEDRVVAEPGGAEERIEACHVLVNIRDHPEEFGGAPALIAILLGGIELELLIGRGVFPGRVKRRMRGVERQVAEEGAARSVLLLHPRHGAVKPKISAIAGEPLFNSVVEVASVPKRVCKLRCGSETPAADMHRFLKAAIHWPMGVVVTKMPLAEQARPVAGRSKHLGHGRNAGPDERAPARYRGRAIAHGVLPGKQLPARRCAHRRDMEVGEPRALFSQPVEVRRLEHRISVAGEIAHSLIVG